MSKPKCSDPQDSERVPGPHFGQAESLAVGVEAQTPSSSRNAAGVPAYPPLPRILRRNGAKAVRSCRSVVLGVQIQDFFPDLHRPQSMHLQGCLLVWEHSKLKPLLLLLLLFRKCAVAVAVDFLLA